MAEVGLSLMTSGCRAREAGEIVHEQEVKTEYRTAPAAIPSGAMRDMSRSDSRPAERTRLVTRIESTWLHEGGKGRARSMPTNDCIVLG